MRIAHSDTYSKLLCCDGLNQVLNCCLENPTSPLGLGGLAWGVCVYLVLTLERFTSPPTPSPWARASPGPRRRRLLERLVGHLAALLFSIVFSMPFFDFPPQLGTQNRPKSLKNRCQDAFHLGLHCLIDFWSVLALNLDAFGPKKPNFSLGKLVFFEKSCSRCSGGSIFEILGVEVGSKHRPKID